MGRRLLKRLLALGLTVRILVRRPEGLSPGVDRKHLEICQGDVLDEQAESAPTAEPTAKGWLERRMILETWQVRVNAAPKTVYHAFASLGGERGWRPCHGLWALRAALDRLIGGIGMRKGRPPVEELAAGDTIDFYLLEKVTAGRNLRLRVEMKLPGTGWMQFEAGPVKPDASL